MALCLLKIDMSLVISFTLFQSFRILSKTLLYYLKTIANIQIDGVSEAHCACSLIQYLPIPYSSVVISSIVFRMVTLVQCRHIKFQKKRLSGEVVASLLLETSKALTGSEQPHSSLK